MDTIKPKRGRPIGSGIDDSQTLATIADKILEAPELRPTTAYKLIAHRPSQASIRRIQAKWKAQHDHLLNSAMQRKMERLVAKQHSTNGIAVANLARRNSIAGQLGELQIALQNPTFRAFQEIRKHSILGQIMMLQEQSAFAQIQKLTETNSFSRMVKAIDASPWNRMVKAQNQLRETMFGLGTRFPDLS